MEFKTLFIFIILNSFSCNNNAGSSAGKNAAITNTKENNPYEHIKNIPLPAGFERINCFQDSFACYLRNIELKKDRTVYLFNRQPKANQSAQFAVLNITVSNKDLQQCADAVMRLRAEFLYTQKEFEQIIFFDNSSTVYKFSLPYTRGHFSTYLNKVFGMCGTASLSRQLKHVDEFDQIMPGDVLIRGGFPGHAVIVTDVAVNDEGEKIYLLAQGYMPAQDIHLLINPEKESLSPWYEVNNHSDIIQTPEYSFTKRELKRW
ncbi:MAG: DUF4846 domain-containing protein [Ferruginibacter sp.]